MSYGGWASGYRWAQHLRHIMIGLKMAAVREQVGITFVPGAAPALEDDPGSTSMRLLNGNLDTLLAELVWRANAPAPARRR